MNIVCKDATQRLAPREFYFPISDGEQVGHVVAELRLQLFLALPSLAAALQSGELRLPLKDGSTWSDSDLVTVQSDGAMMIHSSAVDTAAPIIYSYKWN